MIIKGFDILGLFRVKFLWPFKLVLVGFLFSVRKFFGEGFFGGVLLLKDISAEVSSPQKHNSCL